MRARSIWALQAQRDFKNFGEESEGERGFGYLMRALELGGFERLIILA